MAKMFQEFLVPNFEVNYKGISFLKHCCNLPGVKYALFQDFLEEKKVGIKENVSIFYYYTS